MATAAILKNCKLNNSVIFQAIFTKFELQVQNVVPKLSYENREQKLKNKMAAAAILNSVKQAYLENRLSDFKDI